MIGPGGVIEALVERLDEALPGKLQVLRTLNSIEYNDVPNPYQVIGHEPESEGLDELPAIYVVEQTSTSKPIHTDETGTDFQVDTPVFIFAMVSGYSYESTAQGRRLYTLAVREVLLERTNLAEGINVLPNITEAHSITERREMDSALFGGVRIQLTVRSHEHLDPYVPPVGSIPAAGVDLTFQVIRHADHPTENP